MNEGTESTSRELLNDSDSTRAKLAREELVKRVAVPKLCSTSGTWTRRQHSANNRDCHRVRGCTCGNQKWNKDVESDNTHKIRGVRSNRLSREHNHNNSG